MKFNGPLFVAIAAISYGFPATLMKLAYGYGAKTVGVLFFLFFFSMVFLTLMSFIQSKKQTITLISIDRKIMIICSGGAIALTNTCYFLSLLFVPVAVTAVMLMQSVWIAIALICLINRRLPSLLQLVAVIMILVGTVLATDLLSVSQEISIFGLFLGFLAGFFYALTILFASKLAVDVPALERAKLMSIGAFILIVVIWGKEIFVGALLQEMLWGAIIAIFAMVLPLICLAYGMPKTSAGKGEIISSLELPATILFAWVFLSERIDGIQFLGVVIIMVAIVLTCVKKREVINKVKPD